MTTFVDTFDRANGALGGNWVNAWGTGTVSAGNLVTASQYCLVYNTTVQSGTRQSASIHLISGNLGDVFTGPAVCCGNGQQSFFGALYFSSGNWHADIFVSIGNAGSGLVGANLGPSLPPYNKLELVWETGTLSLLVNGVQVTSVVDGRLSTMPYMGVRLIANGPAVTDFSCVGGTPPLLGIDPSVIGNYGACVPVALTGTNTAWTPGTPGSPAFTVDHGSISSQTVTDSTHATLTYCPGTWLGAVTFTDPSTGQTVGALVTSDPALVPVGGAGLSQTAIDYIERSAIAESGGTIVNREQSINAFAGLQTLTETITTINAQVTTPTQPVAGVGSLLAFVIEIFDLINGGNNWGGAATVFGNTSLIKSGVDDANTAIADLRGAGGVTLATLAAALSNLRGVGQPSLADVLSAVGTPDLGPLSDKLDAMRGDTTTSLYTLLSSLAGLRTVSAYSLGDVMDAIGSIGGAPSAPTAAAVVALVAALALAAPTGGASVAAAAVAVGAGPVLDLATIVELVGVLGELATIAADVASIKSQPSGSYLGAPMWPGSSLADLGTSLALGSRGTITEPMDGVLVDVDHADTDHKPAYDYNGHKAWRNIGGLAFASGDGHFDTYQALGFESQIFTPKTLRRAASVHWFTTHGPIGTIRAWTVKP